MTNGLLLILVAFLLVLLNAFFVAAEFALVKLTPHRVQALAKQHRWRGRVLRVVHGNLDAYLSACQLGITLASLALGWIGEPAFARVLHPLLYTIGVDSEQALHAVAFTAAFSIISYLHIVIGEQAPKSMAIRVADQVGIWTAVPLYAFYWLMYPAIWLLNTSATWVLRVMGLDVAHGHDSHYSADELKMILRASRANANFAGDEWRVLAQALDFRDLDVSDLMRPFEEAVVISERDNRGVIFERIADHRFSRYPYLDRQGRVRGVVHVKDLVVAQRNGMLPGDIGSFARRITTVPPTLRASELFRRFRSGASHFAIVASRDGRPIGFVTMDDLLGALVGEIRDEFRQAVNQWTKLADGSLVGSGSLPIYTLERALGVDIEAPDVASVGGLVLERLHAVPEEGQRIEFDDFDVVVTKLDGSRITGVRIHPKERHA
jgi:CBS domain containing-hemolysin-like protein